MDAETRQTLIARYKAGHAEVVAALDGITEQELDARPAPGKWSPREIVHHLADSEMTSAIRLRLLLVEDAPAIRGYDQDAFARQLHYDRPIAASLAACKAARETTGELLDRMREEDWARAGTPSPIGPYPVTRWLEIYAEHAHGHAEQIRRARALARA
jgi:hypothetical protein